jgi:hypothetical protein
MLCCLGGDYLYGFTSSQSAAALSGVETVTTQGAGGIDSSAGTTGSGAQ